MKEALVLITGQPRFTDISLSNMKRTVLDALSLSGFKVRVVTALWDSNSYDKFRTTVGDKASGDTIKKAFDILQPVKSYSEPARDFFATRKTNKIQVPLKEAPAYESQYYMLERGVNAAADYIRDHGVLPSIAIRTRADLLLMRPLASAAMNTATRRFIIPSHQGHGWVGSIPPKPWKLKKPWMPDQFWMAPWRMLETMCRFHSRWSMSLTRNGHNIEHMLHTFAQDNDIGYDQFSMHIKIEKTVNNR
jgi:hypothetical protein